MYYTILSLICFVVIVQAQFPANVTDIIRSEGYVAEEHKVVTEDGYILTMIRIPHGKHNTVAANGAVLFQHGLFNNAFAGVCNPPIEGLAYFLAEAGFDVWLGNNRGNGISMEHEKYSPHDRDFWDFSLDDFADYDLPAQLDYVIKATGQKKVPYIGDSQGTYQGFAGFLTPETAMKTNLFVALAPVAYIYNVDIKFFHLLSEYDFGHLLALLGFYEVNVPELLHKLLPDLCKDDPTECDFAFSIITGNYTYKNDSQMPFYLNYIPAPTSIKNLIHYAQGVRENVFQKYDYGDLGNMIHYKQKTPPTHDLTKWPSSVPLALFTGTIDRLADPTDVAHLLSLLPTKPFVHNEPDFGHSDFTLGDAAYKKVYPLVVEQLLKVSGQ